MNAGVTPCNHAFQSNLIKIYICVFPMMRISKYLCAGSVVSVGHVQAKNKSRKEAVGAHSCSRCKDMIGV